MTQNTLGQSRMGKERGEEDYSPVKHNVLRGILLILERKKDGGDRKDSLTKGGNNRNQ